MPEDPNSSMPSSVDCNMMMNGLLTRQQDEQAFPIRLEEGVSVFPGSSCDPLPDTSVVVQQQEATRVVEQQRGDTPLQTMGRNLETMIADALSNAKSTIPPCGYDLQKAHD